MRESPAYSYADENIPAEKGRLENTKETDLLM